MPNIHPSLIVRMSIDERIFSDELALEIKRNYNHVATTFIDSHEAKSDETVNTYRYDVILHKNYWGADSDSLWQKDLPEWIHNAIYKVSNNIVAQNKTARAHGQKLLEFEWAEINFVDNVLFAFKTKPDSSISQSVIDFIISARELMNNGALGTGLSSVCIPSHKSYEEQLAKIANGELKTDDMQLDDAEANNLDEGSDDASEKTIASDFIPDTQIWGIEYKDGTSREFDSLAKQFI